MGDDSRYNVRGLMTNENLLEQVRILGDKERMNRALVERSLATDDDAIAIMRAALHMEHILRSVISWQLHPHSIPDSDWEHISFRSALAFASALQLVDPRWKAALARLGLVRNAFAHTPYRELSPEDVTLLTSKLPFQVTEYVADTAPPANLSEDQRHLRAILQIYVLVAGRIICPPVTQDLRESQEWHQLQAQLNESIYDGLNRIVRFEGTPV